MPLLVEAPAPGPAGELEVLARREGGPSGAAVLGEALNDDGAGWHVDPERQRLGGEDQLEQPGGEALLHRLAEDRDEAGMMRRHTALQALEPLVVAEDSQVVVVQRFHPTLDHLADGGALGGVGEANAVAHDLMHSVVAGGAAEDEDDGRQHFEVLELFDHLGAPGRPVGQPRPPPPPLPVRGSTDALQRPAHSLVDAQPFAAGPPVLQQERAEQRLAVLASMDGEMVPQHDRSLPLDDDRRVASHRTQPATELVRVVHGGREADEANFGRAEDENLLPDPAAVRILNEVNLVEHHRVQALEEIGAGQQHVAEHLGGHDDHRRPGTQRGVAGQQPHVLFTVGGDQLTVLLVRQCLERCRVERLAVGGQGPVHRVGGHQRLAGPGGSGHQYRVPRAPPPRPSPGRATGRWSTPEQLPDADGEEVEDDERDCQREHGEGIRARREDGGHDHNADDGPAPRAQKARRRHDAGQLERDEDDRELEGQAEDRHHQEDESQVRDRVVDRRPTSTSPARAAG